MMPQDPLVAIDYALHGNAFNPDMGELAEYGELSCSSDGHLWQVSNATKIHSLAQGNDQTPTLTPCSSSHLCCAAQQKGTLSAHTGQRKPSPIVSGGLWVVTKLNMMEMSVPKLPTLSQQNYYSTVWYLHPVDAA